jgi:Uma2 family endonuclease
MSAMTVLQVPGDGWTTDTLPDTEFRYELVDGALLVTPPPELTHVVIANRLGHRLRTSLSDDWEVVTDPGVYFDLRNYREPDMVVFRRAVISTGRLSPSDVLLAVEVMSSGSGATDRIAKPAQYAAAGIAHFWRIEQDPLVLVTHELDGDVYRETGRFTDDVALTRPVQVSFALRELAGP